LILHTVKPRKQPKTSARNCSRPSSRPIGQMVWKYVWIHLTRERPAAVIFREQGANSKEIALRSSPVRETLLKELHLRSEHPVSPCAATVAEEEGDGSAGNRRYSVGSLQSGEHPCSRNCFVARQHQALLWIKFCPEAMNAQRNSSSGVKM
jgi:hypothetical protein